MVTLPNGKTFKVKTDYDSLKYFLEQRLSSEEQQKWVTKMLSYDFEIIYKKGKQNIVGDALKKGWACGSIVVCNFYYPTRLDKQSKGGMEEWQRSVGTYLKVTTRF